MKKQLLDYINSDKFEAMTFSGIKRFLGVSRKHMDDDVRDMLLSFELEGLLYEDKDGLYKKFPSNFFVTEVSSTAKNTKYIIINGNQVLIRPKNLNGALTYDKVIVSYKDNQYNVEKILIRRLPNVVCEVRINSDGKKYLYPINTNNNLKVTIGTKDMKKLLVGQRVLVNTTTEKYDDMYVGKYVKTIGNINDPDIDFKTIAYGYGFNLEFPDKVMEEVRKIPTKVREEDTIGRVDLRNENIFTIDGSDCKDMDDAVSIKKLDNGNYVLSVHIAHVSHYVKLDSEIFKEAARRTTSVYFPNSVVPMLPFEISNGICSLNENEDRLTRTTDITFSPTGKILDFKTYKSVIRSKKKMNYDDVSKIISSKEVPEGYENFAKELKLMGELSRKLSTIKNERGYIGLVNEELKFKLDSLCNTVDIKVEDNLESHELIENFMLIPNHLVTTLFCLPFIYRCHGYPSEFKVNELLYKLKELGYHTNNLKNMKTSFLLQRLIKDFRDKEEFSVISQIILRSLKLAYYSVENEGHFGLALESYTHYTSPIRRLPDLIVHHLIDLYESEELNMEKLEQINNLLIDLCERSSFMERQADKAEYEADKLQVINYIKSHIGEERIGFIEMVNPSYIKVRVPGLMDGIVYSDNMPEMTYLTPGGKLKGTDTERTYKVGHKVLLNLLDASYADKMIYYKLVDNLTLTEAEGKKLVKRV